MRREFPVAVKKALPSRATLLAILSYDPNTGRLVRRDSGSPALATKGEAYWRGHIAGFGKLYAHRVIWKMVFGEDPEGIDHINGNGFDNRLSNLRAVDHSTNCRNRRLRSDNTSGRVGVQWHPKTRKWRATIYIGRRVHLGLFDRFEDAVAARTQAEITQGFGPTHGRHPDAA